MPRSDQSRYWLAAEASLGLALVALPASLGGAPAWTLWLLAAIASLALLLWALGASRHHRRWGLHPVLLLPLLVGVCAALQLIPLPPKLLAMLSPPAAELRDFALVPLGLERWRPVTLDAPSSLRALSRVLSLAMLLFVATELGRRAAVRRRLMMVLALSATATALCGFIHLLAGLDALFGVHRFYAPSQLVTPFGNTNHLAAFLTLGGTVCLGLALEAKSREAVVGWGVAALLNGLGVFLSFSRGGIAALVLVWLLVGASVLAYRGGGLRNVLPWVLIGGTAAMAGLLAFEQLAVRALSVSTVDALKATKMDLWPSMFAGAGKHWPLGMGLGAYELAFARFNDKDPSVTFTHPENLALQYSSELGFPAALLLGALGLWLASRTWQRVHSLALERVAFLAVLGVVIHDLFDFALELNAVSVGATIVLGLLCGAGADGEGRRSLRTHGLPVALAPVLASFALLLMGLPTHSAAEESLAAALKAGREASEVRALGLQLIDRHPSDFVLYANLAADASRRADPRESLAWVNRVLFLRPQDARSHVVAAQALLRMRRPLQALGELKLAWLNGDESTLQLGLSVARRERAMERLLLDKPGHTARVYHLLRASSSEQALALLALALEFPPSPAVAQEASLLMVRHEAEVGSPQKALVALDALPTDLQRRSEQVLVRVHALVKLGRQDDAVGHLEALLAREPGNVEVGLVLVDLLSSIGRPLAGRDVLRRIRPFANAHSHRLATFEREAALLLQEERYPGALEALQTAARIEPTRPDFHYRIAQVYERMGSLRSALDEVRQGRLLDTPAGASAQDAWVARLEASLSGR